MSGLPRVIWQDGITAENEAEARRMAEAAIAAVMRCTPLSFPQSLYRNGTFEFELTFSPSAAA